MTPLSGETRKGKVYSLTTVGRDAARQLLVGTGESDDDITALLRLLEAKQQSAGYLTRKIKDAARHLKALEKKGFVEVEDISEERDPLRASAERLRVEFLGRAADKKLPKAQRELLAFLELHPGGHNLGVLEESMPGASVAARALGRAGLLYLKLEPAAIAGGFERPAHALNPHQQAAFDKIAEAIAVHQYRTFLLQGVTGSGKTEVYLKSIEAALADGRGALLLVPEIALTPAVAGQFSTRFGDKVAILHSAFHDAERSAEWRRIQAGTARVVVATRSGVFAPVRNLGLIVVDEEHDQSYKQGETPRYNGRDVAIVRAREAGAVVVLGSATPSLESRYNCDAKGGEKSKYELLLLPERIEARPMPKVTIIDMREEFLETRKSSPFSRALLDAIQHRLENKEQTMLLLNRRGFSSFVACRACGWKMECINCAVTLTYHRRDRRMLCHYCGYAEKVPARCPKCDSDYIQFLGTGAEKIEDELHNFYPEARIARLDRDTASHKRDFLTILSGFREGAFDILVGTQMIAKGHDIPNVTLVGVVNADIGLALPDFRSAERAFQLLTQAAGRAGRGHLPGIVLIQTINPDHYAIRHAAAQDYDAFYEKELQFRSAMRYPPFAALASVLVRSESQEEALRMSGEIGNLAGAGEQGIKILGPAEAAVPKLKREFRYQMIIKAASRKRLNEMLQTLRRYAMDRKWNAPALSIDVDPLSLM
ncbi:MAG: primosomal protein N' [Bryobacteraceae bacterium]